MPAKLLTSTALAGLIAAGAATTAAAEIEVSAYGGYQTSPHSRIDGTLPGGGDFSELIGWDGDSLLHRPTTARASLYGAKTTGVGVSN